VSGWFVGGSLVCGPWWWLLVPGAVCLCGGAGLVFVPLVWFSGGVRLRAALAGVCCGAAGCGWCVLGGAAAACCGLLFGLRCLGVVGAACRRLIAGVRVVLALQLRSTGGGPAWGVVVGVFLWVLLGMLLCFALWEWLSWLWVYVATCSGNRAVG
jgi:hypothetical protein